MVDIQFGGLLGFIILALDIWAIITVIQSSRTTGSKLLWVLLILVLPVVGLLIWFLIGRRAHEPSRA